MTSSPEAGPEAATVPASAGVGDGSEVGARVAALESAVGAATGRLDDRVLAPARTVTDRAAARLRLSADHTVVAIAGATGSGKSSTFNALTGLELSAVGVRRPTTSWATACVWGSDGAHELLEWLGIPARHQTTRDSMLDTRREDNALDGVVLLDLPDHDSTEVSHHLEVDRLVALADMMVWVLDPQKYADAAIHHRYLEPLRTHGEVMVVVLNHIDTVPPERRQAMVDDVRRLLEADGLPDVPVVAVSAREGIGLDDLRALIRRRVEEKRMSRARLQADVRAAAERVEEVSGTAAPRSLSDERVQRLEDGLAEAAGVPAVAEAVERSTRSRARRATGWPPVAWVSALRPDPLAKLGLDLGDEAATLGGRSGRGPEAASVQRSRVDSEVRSLLDDVTDGLAEPWAVAVRREPVAALGTLGDRLDESLRATDLGASRLPGWVQLVRVLQWLLLLAAVGGGVWALLDATGTVEDGPEVAGISVPLLLLGGGVLLGLVLWLVSAGLVRGAARRQAERAEVRLRESIAAVSSELVVTPVRTELAAYETCHRGLATALR